MNTETKRKLNAMLMHDFITAIEAQEANSSMYLPMSFDDRFNAIMMFTNKDITRKFNVE